MQSRVNAGEARRLQFAAAEVEFQMHDTGNEICTAHLRLLLNAEKTGQKSQLSLSLDPPESMLSYHCTIYPCPSPILTP
jgi:hypothetical protein